jgi:hypothetical protein
MQNLATQKKIINPKLQINHNNFSNNNNPVSFSAFNINIFSKDQNPCDFTDDKMISMEYNGIHSQAKLNVNNLSKTDPFCRINSRFAEDTSLHYMNDNTNMFKTNEQYPNKGLFDLERPSLNEKSKSINSLLISKSSINQLSYKNCNQRYFLFIKLNKVDWKIR